MMLVHIGQGDIAEKVHNAWLATIEQGIGTYDIAGEGKEPYSTSAFADEVIKRVGEKPQTLPAVSYPSGDSRISVTTSPVEPSEKTMDGIDVFVHDNNRDPEALAAKLNAATDGTELELNMISNRGLKVWPGGLPETFCVDHWRCRFVAPDEGKANTGQVVEVLSRLNDAGVDFIKTEGLYRFDGELGYSLGQGQ